ncbi:preprotein translocase subunit SecE [Candidatus Fermentibacteria bacterium]|nr:preprotein translocase subunit SecE [Candidatus Fermentibacteria bacterium]
MAGKVSSDGNIISRALRTSIRFLGEVRIELTKVAWPTKDEIVASTWVVVGAVAVAAVWIYIADKFSSVMMSLLIGLFS